MQFRIVIAIVRSSSKTRFSVEMVLTRTIIGVYLKTLIWTEIETAQCWEVHLVFCHFVTQSVCNVFTELATVFLFLIARSIKFLPVSESDFYKNDSPPHTRRRSTPRHWWPYRVCQLFARFGWKNVIRQSFSLPVTDFVKTQTSEMMNDERTSKPLVA